MVIVDTSVWINHFRKTDIELEYLLNETMVSTHPYIIGELTCGNFKNRKLILSLLNVLPTVPIVSQSEYLHFVELHKLWGMGLGFIDIHLLASATISKTPIYTHDKALRTVAIKLNLAK